MDGGGGSFASVGNRFPASGGTLRDTYAERSTGWKSSAVWESALVSRSLRRAKSSCDGCDDRFEAPGLRTTRGEYPGTDLGSGYECIAVVL